MSSFQRKLWVNEVEGTVILLKKGEGGYYPSNCDIQGNALQASVFARERNQVLDISEEMAEVMTIKSMFAWERNESEEEQEIAER